MYYVGDFLEDATVYLMFNTFSSDDPSASVTITNFANTDVHIHKNDGLVQRNNAAGITVSIDFDGITGSHMIKIDTSDDTVAGFWVTGADYFVRIEGTTIDGATINAVVGHFSIENRNDQEAAIDAIAAATQSGIIIPAGYVGDYRTGETIYLLWATHVALDTAGSIRVYKNNGTTEVTAPTGITDTRNFDSLTNVHLCAVNTGANTFYEENSDYTVVLQGAVEGGNTINVIIGSFSIENRSGIRYLKNG